MTPCFFFLRGYGKKSDFIPLSASDIDEVKNRTRGAVASVSVGMSPIVHGELAYGLLLVCVAANAYIE